jgi:branched-chain amino acid transport system substrate-binding protein
MHSTLRTGILLLSTSCVGVPVAGFTPQPGPELPPRQATTLQPAGQTPEAVRDAGAQEPVEPVAVEPVAARLDPATAARFEAAAELGIGPLIEALDSADAATVRALADLDWNGDAALARRLRLVALERHSGQVSDLPDAPRHPSLLAAFERLRGRYVETVPRRIGLLLPVDTPWGAQLEEAFRLALGEDSGLEVIVRGSLDPEESVRQLAFEDRVSLIVSGPFLKRARRAAVRAAQIGIPTISLGREEGMAALSPVIFQVGVTNRQQIQALVEAAVQGRGYKRFAMLFPRTKTGWRAAEEFAASAAREGAEITYAQPYRAEETTFTDLIKAMVGRDPKNLARTPQYHRCVKEISKSAKGLRRKRAVESCRDHTPPQIDFDAIFIPDTAGNVRQLMPFIELNDMVPNLNGRQLWKTRRATGNKELAPTPILGLRQLNSIYFATRTRTEVEGALFVDAYFPYDSKRPQPGAFARDFRKRLRRAPNLLEVLAYDVGNWVVAVDKAGKLTDWKQVVEGLRETSSRAAVSGLWSLGGDGQVQRPLYRLTILKRKIVSEAARAAAVESKGR